MDGIVQIETVYLLFLLYNIPIKDDTKHQFINIVYLMRCSIASLGNIRPISCSQMPNLNLSAENVNHNMTYKLCEIQMRRFSDNYILLSVFSRNDHSDSHVFFLCPTILLVIKRDQIHMGPPSSRLCGFWNRVGPHTV